MELKAYMVGGSDSEAERVVARTASFSGAIDKEQMWILCKIACAKMVSRPSSRPNWAPPCTSSFFISLSHCKSLLN